MILIYSKDVDDFETNRLDIMLEAKRQGLKRPHTLITGSKSKLESFFNLYESKNGMISKRILDSYLYEDIRFNKVQFKKVLGPYYYYSKTDVTNLFTDK